MLFCHSLQGDRETEQCINPKLVCLLWFGELNSRPYMYIYIHTAHVLSAGARAVTLDRKVEQSARDEECPKLL